VIDVSPDPPVSHEQVIEQKLVACGLSADGFTVKYENYLQSIEIVIGPSAGASEANFECIHEASGYEIVTFEDGATQLSYLDFEAELHRPEMVASSIAELEKLGLLDGFPERNAFADLGSYARALEVHSGVTAGSALRVSGENITFDPPFEGGFDSFADKYGKLLAAIRYASARRDFERFGVIGNEKYREPEGE
jgi:hypothetical protein